jgi:peptide/nickel transport system permease protein
MATAGVWTGSSNAVLTRTGRVLRRRLLQLVPVLLGVTLVTFLLVRMLPGGPVQTLTGVRASPATIAAVERQLGLKQPLPQQYLHYLSTLAHGELGYSLISGVSVRSIISTHLAVTLELIAFAVVLALLLGIPLAALAAYRRDTLVDHGIRALVVATLGLPSFWIGALFVAYFGLHLGWFPTGGNGSGVIDRLHHLFLPALTLAFTFLAVIVRSLRASISDILRADFVDAARLKGVGRRQLLSRHVLRIAVMPVVTLVGLNVSYLLGTSVIVENVFAIDGIGQQLVGAVLQRDFLVVQGITFVFGILVVAVSLAVDLIQALLDPRAAA